MNHEDAVLSAMLLHPAAARVGAESATAADFTSPRNAALFAALTKLVRAGTTDLDEVVVLQSLNGQLEFVGGKKRIAELIEADAAPANIERYIGALKRDNAARKAQEIGQALVEEKTTPEEAQAALSAIIPAAQTTEKYTVGDLLEYDVEHDVNCLLGRRWLCKGGSVVWVGQTGLGKSAVAVQASLLWALGLDFFGVQPVRPLRSAIVQAENDQGDLSEEFRGIVNGLSLHDRVADLTSMVSIRRESSAVGDAALALAERICREEQPDLLWFDPLWAFAGCDLTSATEAAALLRTGLNPILQRYGVAVCLIHHTTKPKENLGGKRKRQDYSYDLAGSAEISNWTRAIVSLSEVDDDSYQLRFAKRGVRAGLLDSSGNETTEIYLQHAQRGICWERSSGPVDFEEVEIGSYVNQVLEKSTAFSTPLFEGDFHRFTQEVCGVKHSIVYKRGSKSNKVWTRAWAEYKRRKQQ